MDRLCSKACYAIAFQLSHAQVRPSIQDAHFLNVTQALPQITPRWQRNESASAWEIRSISFSTALAVSFPALPQRWMTVSLGHIPNSDPLA
jgi:hypothetical protein